MNLEREGQKGGSIDKLEIYWKVFLKKKNRVERVNG